MWFLILFGLIAVALAGVLVAGDLRARRRRKGYGDWDFASRDRSGSDPQLRETNEADLNVRTRGRMREIQRDAPWDGGGGVL